MEKIRVTLTNGEDNTIEHDSIDRTFDDIMQFQEASFVVKAKNGTRIPIRNILYYRILDQDVENTTTEVSNG